MRGLIEGKQAKHNEGFKMRIELESFFSSEVKKSLKTVVNNILLRIIELNYNLIKVY